MHSLERAVQIAGGQTALARAIGTRQANIWNWLNRSGAKVPGEFCIPIEAATQGLVSRTDLRPDLYPAEAMPASSPDIAVGVDLAQPNTSLADLVSEIEDMTEETRRNLKGTRS